MADIDTSSYQNKVLPLNPLDVYGKAATLQGALNQNKLFQQQFQTNKAVSDIYKRAVRPDGTLDMDAIRDEVSKNPAAAYGLEQVFKGAQGLQQGQIATDTSQLENTQKHLQAISGYLTPLIKPGASSRDVSEALAHAVTNGVANVEQAAKLWANLPRNPQTGQIDEGKIPAWAQQQQMQVLTAQERLNAMHPAPTMQQLPGGGQAPFVMPQVGQVQQVGPTIQAAPPPTTTVMGPDGVPRYVGAPQGNNPYEPGAQGGVSGGMPATQGGGIAGQPAAMSPAAQAASQETGGFSAKQGTALQARADQVPTTKAILGNLEAELNTPGFETGPGTKSVADLAKFLNTQLGTNIRTEGLAGREQFNKLAGMLAQSQFQALGGTGTDAKLDATTLTSPNSELTKMGNRGIIALLKGNEDAITVKNRAWQAWQQQNGPQSYGQFSTEFNKAYDPRVFQIQYLEGADKTKLITGMTASEQKTFRQSYNTAVANGWIPDPRSGQ